jgi:transposase
MQADAYAGFNRLYKATRKGGPIVEAACWGHARRKLFDLARINQAPIVSEAVARIDALPIERDINGLAPRVAVRSERSWPLILALETWLREQRGRISKNSDTGNAIKYSLKHWTAPPRFLDDGHLCMTNNAAERELRRRSWPSPAPMKAAGGQLPSIRIATASSTTSIRRPGSPTCSLDCWIIRCG